MSEVTASDAHPAALSDRLAALRDPALRLAWGNDLLRRCSDGDCVALLSSSLGDAGRAPSQDDLMLVLSLVLIQPEHEARRQAIGAEAAVSGPREVAWLFGRRPAEVPLNKPRPSAGARGGRPLTLGERKSLARGIDRQLLIRVFDDPHPDVAAIVLGNPRVTEVDVRRMASRRPIDPDVLLQILGHPRWAMRYAVRLACLQNPHLPLHAALPLAALLRPSDARTLASAPDLREALRIVCQWVAAPPTAH